jgi:biotin-(acetyl-CoA carboxylase) ligase
MKTLKLFTLTFVIGLFVTANISSAVQSDQERRQDRQDRQERHEQHEGMQQRQERDIEITQLPQKVQETLRDDYEDWRPAEAAIVTDPEEHEEGAFYQVKLNKTENGEQETKVVMIDNDGEVIDEKDGEEFERETQQRRDREGSSSVKVSGTVNILPPNEQQQRQQQDRQQQERRGQQHQEGHMQQRQERDIEITQLPQKVQETLRDDYEDWRPAEAAIVTDPEEHEEGAFYQVKLNKTENGEQETKVVMIDNDGEVIDEKDGEEFERETQQRHDREGHQREGQRDREYTPAQYQQDRQQQERRGQQHQEGHMQQRQERDIEITQLPQKVQETLRDDYEDWRPAEAAIVTDPEEHEEGAFYQVKLNKTENGEQETKVVMIDNDGEVIDEKDGEEFERETQQRHDREGHQREGQRDREYTPAQYQQDRQQQERREGMARQERDIELDELPQQVQETLREDYEEWRQTEAVIVTDPEEYEDGSFYKVTLNRTDNGERETKIVKIARDGEVIDEEDPDNDGWF